MRRSESLINLTAFNRHDAVPVEHLFSLKLCIGIWRDTDLLIGVSKGLDGALTWLSMMSLVVGCLSSPHSSLFTTFCGLRLASGNIRLFSSSLTFSRLLYGLDVIILRLEIKILRKMADRESRLWHACCSIQLDFLLVKWKPGIATELTRSIINTIRNPFIIIHFAYLHNFGPFYINF